MDLEGLQDVEVYNLTLRESLLIRSDDLVCHRLRIQSTRTRLLFSSLAVFRSKGDFLADDPANSGR